MNTPCGADRPPRCHPGKPSYGSPGLGSSGHLAGEQFKQINNLDIAHVHYRGAAPALQDLVAGHVQVMFDIVPLTKAQLAAGRVRPLARSRRPSANLWYPTCPRSPSLACLNRGRALVWTVRTGRQCRAWRSTGSTPRPTTRVFFARSEGAARRAGADASARHAGGVRHARHRRDRALGRGHPQGQHQG